MGEVVTFYSYKGGVGRTMALANVAMWLTQAGFKTLMIDWDLEAPGLEYYFSDVISPRSVSDMPGILDLLSDAGAAVESKAEWQEYVIQLEVTGLDGELHLIPSGKRDNDYFGRLRNLDMGDFYQNKGGYFIESMRNEWKNDYDFILVDSRTGVTDMGGICTIQLPDYLVMMFVANDQNLQGIRQTAEGIRRGREEIPFDRYFLPIVPMLSRFDSTEEFRISKEWIRQIARQLDTIYQDWLPTSIQTSDFIVSTKLPYIPYFSFGERIPLIEQGVRDPAGLGFAYESLSALLVNGLERVGDLLSDRDGFVRSARNNKRWTDGLPQPQNLVQRIPVIILLDTSASMTGPPINALNEALNQFADRMRHDPFVANAVDIAVVAFGGEANVVQQFVPISRFAPPKLRAGGMTAMGSAIHKGLDLLRIRKDHYKANAVPYFRPWMILISDGSPTDEWQTAARRVAAEERSRNLTFFPVGVGDFDEAVLRSISPTRGPLRLAGLQFDELFDWLSSSMAMVTNSTSDTMQLSLPPISWSQIDL